MVHRLKIDPIYHIVKQKKWTFNLEHRKAIIEELDMLVKAGFIWDLMYPNWLTNMMLVKKVNRKWQMCIDFTNLNKACPKDSYPLSQIDRLINAISSHELLTFIDAFSNHNQI